jgi:iron complex outermembrane receptor protein
MRRLLYLCALAFIILQNPAIAQQERPDTLISLEAVEILGAEVPEQAYIINSLDRIEIGVLPASDIGGMMRNIPNVNGIRKGGAVLDPVIRGFKYSQLNVQVDGGLKIEGGCPNRMDPATAHIDVDDIRELEVIKGPFALRYGPNFGGVVNMKTIRPLPQSEFKINVGAILGYESNWNGFKQRLSVDGGNDKVFFSLSGNLKKYGDYKDGNGNEIKSSFNKYNYTAQLGVSPGYMVCT